MPGDAFYFPSVSEHPSITGSGAVIGTKTYVRFINAHTYFLNAGIPLGTYVVNFASNQYFAQNTLSGASVEPTWNMAGSPNALTALHLRYDPTYKTYLSVEQHFVGEHEYAILSVDPATRAEKWWNLVYEKLARAFKFRVYAVHRTANWLQRAASGATDDLSQRDLCLSAFVRDGVLAAHELQPSRACRDPKRGQARRQPRPSFAGSAHATSFQNRIAKLPLFEQIYEGYGFNHDTVGGNQYLQGFPGEGPPIPTPGLQAYGAPCANQHGAPRLPGRSISARSTRRSGIRSSVQPLHAVDQAQSRSQHLSNLLLQRQLQQTVPVELAAHWINTSSENFSISRQVSHALNAYAGYQILNTADNYINGGYTPCEPVNTSTCPLSFTSFRGVSTQRTTSLGINAAPNPEFNFSLLLRHHTDYPVPVPGLFGFRPTTSSASRSIRPTRAGAVRRNRRSALQNPLARNARPLTDVLLVRQSVPDTFWQPSFVVQVLPI